MSRKVIVYPSNGPKYEIDPKKLTKRSRVHSLQGSNPRMSKFFTPRKTRR